MMFKNKEIGVYSQGFKYLHWLIALLVAGMLAFGFLLADLPNAIKLTTYMLHKSLGLTLLALMLARIVWLCIAGRSALPRGMPAWERLLAYAVQGALYLFLIAMPLSGWLMATASNKIPVYFGWFRVPFPGILPDKTLSSWMSEAHYVIAFILLALIFLHTAGALKHRFIDKDDVLKRMMP